jgi:hypothetical protein
MTRAWLRTIPCLCVTVTLVAGAAFFVWHQCSKSAHTAAGTSQDGAKLAFEPIIELGPIDNGSFVQVPVELTSRSDRPMRLKGFRSSCGCMQNIYELVSGGRRALGELVLRPEETRSIVCEIRANGETGAKTAVPVSFHEEQGSHYRVVIAYTPVANLYLVPRTLAFGIMPEGRSKDLQLDLRSDGSFVEPLDKITCSAPEAFSVVFRAPPGEQLEDFKKKNVGQHLVGHLAVTLKPQGAGNCDRELVIFNDGKELVRVPVTGIVAAEYQLAPSELVLPRRHASGRPSYHARVICSANDGRPVEAEAVLDKGVPFEVALMETKDYTARIFEVRFTGPSPLQGATQEYRIRFRISGAGADRFLTLPVKMLPEE